MRLLILLNSIRVSGTEKLMLSLARRFEAEGDEVYLFPLITPFDEKFRRSLEQEGKPLNFLFPKYIERYDKAIWKLNGLTTRLFDWSIRSFLLQRYVSKKCSEKNIQLIVSNSYPTDLFVLDVWRKTGIKYIVVDHGSYCYYRIDGTSFSKEPLEHAGTISGVSRWTVEQLKRILPQTSPHLVYNGHVPSLRGSDYTYRDLISAPGHFVFCMHGRGSDQKGWEIAIKAYQAVRDQGFKIKLLLLSEGPYIDSLKEIHGTDLNLIFGNFVYNLADIFDFVNAGLVLSKKYEAFGLTVLDYFSAGIPVVASNLGGIDEVVEREGLMGGLLTEVDDEGNPIVEKAAQKMIELIQNKDLHNSLSRDAKVIAQYFSIDRCAAGYKKIFQSLS